MGRRILRKPVRREPVRRVKHKRNSQVGQRKMKRVVKSLPRCPLNPVNRTRKSGRLNNMLRSVQEIESLSATREANDGLRQERRSTIDTLLSKRRSKRPVHQLNNDIFGHNNSTWDLDWKAARRQQGGFVKAKRTRGRVAPLSWVQARSRATVELDYEPAV